MSKRRMISMLREAARSSGRSPLALVSEILSLRRGPGRLGISEYFDFRLYENDLDMAEKLEFCGYRGQAVLEDILVDVYSKFLALDKLTFYTLMQGYGFPVPAMPALYCQAPRPCPGRRLDTPEALAAFIASDAVFPIYLKPSFGAYGRGNTRVVSHADGLLTLGDGTRVEIMEFCRSLEDRSGMGWLVQEALSAHPEIARICGDRVSSLRVHPFIGREDVSIHRVVWKVNLGTLDSDNFVHGTSGNMLADVDLHTGEVVRVIAGVGPDQRELRSHPVSGEPLLGFRLPGFHEALDYVRRGAMAFPGFLCQGWDVALCERGPVMLEANWFGDVDLPQQSMRKGFLDAAFRELLKARDLERFLDGPARPAFRSRTGRLGWRGSHWPY
jgi:hypothetical protein